MQPMVALARQRMRLAIRWMRRLVGQQLGLGGERQPGKVRRFIHVGSDEPGFGKLPRVKLIRR